MDDKEFADTIDSAEKRSRDTLFEKNSKYAPGSNEDRLNQFYRLADLNKVTATESLWYLVSKHITAVADMVKCPTLHNLENWREKLDDIRNYTLLLDALVTELLPKEEPSNDRPSKARVAPKESLVEQD